jgi:type II secretion system protein G
MRIVTRADPGFVHRKGSQKKQEEAVMKRTAERGFTLVEIMIVVAIIALLAAIAIPNVLRGRATANETAAIGNVRALISSLEMYRSVYQAYPSTAAGWDAAMYDPSPAFGPPSFDNKPMDGGAGSVVQGFRYLYTPVGAIPLQSYAVRAVPDTGNSGTRVFFGNDSGQVFHCSGLTSTATTPPTTMATINAVPTACP